MHMASSRAGSHSLNKKDYVRRRATHGSMFNTFKVDSNKKLLEELEEEATLDNVDLKKIVTGKKYPIAALRMKRVDIEKIYP